MAAALLSLLLLPVGAFLWATDTPGTSFAQEPATPKDADLPRRLEAHVTTLAAGPRYLGKLSSVRTTLDHLSAEVEALGYEVERQEVLAPAQNLIFRLSADRSDAPLLIIGAHWDTFSAMPGADDNASGVASLLELARTLKPMEGNIATEIEFVLFANEEPPYFKTNAMGSLIHARSLPADREIVGMMSLETMGYYIDEPGSQKYPFPLSLRYPDTGNFIAFVGDLSSRDFLRSTIGHFRENARIPSVGGTAPSFVQGIDWSDHWSYSQQGIAAFMVTDTAPFRNPNYHQPTDTPDTLDFERLALVVEGLDATVRKIVDAE